MANARLRLASLWVSQAARVLADWCLRVAAFMQLAAAYAAPPASYWWHLATVVFIAPWVVLAPLNGCLSNGLPRRWLLVGTAAFTLLAVAGGAALPVWWMACLGAVALGAAVYSPTRYAMLPAAAADTAVPLPRVNGWFEAGGAAAILGGMMLGVQLGGRLIDGQGSAALVATLLGLNALCLLTALPAAFTSDRPRPEAPPAAVAGFFRDARRVARDREACLTVLGLAAFQAVVTAGGGVLLARSLDRGLGHLLELLQTLLPVTVGAALGCGAAGLQKHPVRSLGLVPPAAFGLLGALAWAAAAFDADSALPVLPCFLLGFTGGLVNVPLRTAYLAAVPADARGNAMSVMNTAIYTLTSALALLLVGLIRLGVLSGPWSQLAFLALLAAAGAALALYLLFRPTLESGFEVILWPVYRIQAYGPGADCLPERGPLLIVSNHAAYTDPLLIGKIVPRLIHPMMTSAFYDLPFLRWWMVHVFHVIRVEAATFRREAPELAEAVAMLRRGQCVVIFPEAALRRSDEQLLRPFGQGVWHILREVPETPVAVLWIEGGWGSYFSYRNGPPLKNKRFDRWRHIDIGVGEPKPLDAALLVDHRTTRAYLRRACLECRKYLGLAVPDEPQEKKADMPGVEPQAVEP